MNWDDIKVFLEVSRTEKLSQAAGRLEMDPSTVSRRLHRLESEMNTQLFDRSVAGHSLTEHGLSLLNTAKEMERRAQTATELLQGKNLESEGTVRLGVTEAFGNYFIAPGLAKLCRTHPNIKIEMMPLQRFVKWSHQEAEIAVTIEKPPNTSLVVSKLCDYRLALYGSKEYLATFGTPVCLEDVTKHNLISYIDDLVFSDELYYLREMLPEAAPGFSSTSVITQYVAAKEGVGLGILPHFLARGAENLVPVLPEQTMVTRSFWMVAHPEQKKLARVAKVWDTLRAHTEEHAELLMGDP